MPSLLSQWYLHNSHGHSRSKVTGAETLVITREPSNSTEDI
jgi:hypothetical protein